MNFLSKRHLYIEKQKKKKNYTHMHVYIYTQNNELSVQFLQKQIRKPIILKQKSTQDLLTVGQPHLFP